MQSIPGRIDVHLKRTHIIADIVAEVLVRRRRVWGREDVVKPAHVIAPRNVHDRRVNLRVPMLGRVRSQFLHVMSREGDLRKRVWYREIQVRQGKVERSVSFRRNPVCMHIPNELLIDRQVDEGIANNVFGLCNRRQP